VGSTASAGLRIASVTVVCGRAPCERPGLVRSYRSSNESLCRNVPRSAASFTNLPRALAAIIRRRRILPDHLARLRRSRRTRCVNPRLANPTGTLGPNTRRAQHHAVIVRLHHEIRERPHQRIQPVRTAAATAIIVRRKHAQLIFERPPACQRGAPCAAHRAPPPARRGSPCHGSHAPP
jgi:hypothetical protein